MAGKKRVAKKAKGKSKFSEQLTLAVYTALVVGAVLVSAAWIGVENAEFYPQGGYQSGYRG